MGAWTVGRAATAIIGAAGAAPYAGRSPPGIVAGGGSMYASTAPIWVEPPGAAGADIMLVPPAGAGGGNAAGAGNGAGASSAGASAAGSSTGATWATSGARLVDAKAGSMGGLAAAPPSGAGKAGPKAAGSPCSVFPGAKGF